MEKGDWERIDKTLLQGGVVDNVDVLGVDGQPQHCSKKGGIHVGFNLDSSMEKSVNVLSWQKTPPNPQIFSTLYDNKVTTRPSIKTHKVFQPMNCDMWNETN